MDILVTLHVLSAVIWVGGMFFAYMVLRPAAGALSGPDRLKLWAACFGSFFRWVWAAVALLLLTGYTMLFAYYGGFGGAGVHIHIMHLLGWAMFLIFGHVFFAPWKKLRRAVAAEDFEAGARHLALIRRMVGINLLVGLVVIVVATGGRYLF